MLGNSFLDADFGDLTENLAHGIHAYEQVLGTVKEVENIPLELLSEMMNNLVVARVEYLLGVKVESAEEALQAYEQKAAGWSQEEQDEFLPTDILRTSKK